VTRSPLEPLRTGRRLDRRHWLLAGLLGIAGGVIVDGAARGQLVLALGGRVQVSPDIVVLEASRLALGIVLVLVAYAFAPGGVVRSLLGAVVLVVGVGAAIATAAAIQFGDPGILREPVLRMLVNGQTIVLLAGIVGWILASGARWWAWLAVLLPWTVGAAGFGLAFAGVDSGFAIAAGGALSLAIALVTLLLTLPRRR